MVINDPSYRYLCKSVSSSALQAWLTKVKVLPGWYKSCRESSPLPKSISPLCPMNISDLLFFRAQLLCIQASLCKENQSSMAGHSTLLVQIHRRKIKQCAWCSLKSHTHMEICASLKTLLSWLTLRNCPMAFLVENLCITGKWKKILEWKSHFFAR